MANSGVNISFIPKEPLLRGDTVVRRRPVIGLSFLIGFIMFALALLVAGALFIYENELIEDLQESQDELRLVNDQLEKSDIVQSIEELRELRDQIGRVSTVLDGHIAISEIFTFLEETTLSTVSFGSFQLSTDPEGDAATITMSGQASSYADLANQSAVYSDQSDILTKYDIGGLAVTEAGTISFSLTGTIDIDALKYASTLEYYEEPVSEVLND